MKRPWYWDRSGDKPLTSRQEEVMDLVCKGKSYPEIGLILGVSASTAKNHGSAIRRKLKASTKTYAVALWTEKKLKESI